jgi:hypothetical protein
MVKFLGTCINFTLHLFSISWFLALIDQFLWSGWKSTKWDVIQPLKSNVSTPKGRQPSFTYPHVLMILVKIFDGQNIFIQSYLFLLKLPSPWIRIVAPSLTPAGKTTFMLRFDLILPFPPHFRQWSVITSPSPEHFAQVETWKSHKSSNLYTWKEKRLTFPYLKCIVSSIQHYQRKGRELKRNKWVKVV